MWQCGGKVLIATCSRVGHVFRKVSPYSWPGGVVKILNHNMLRTIHVWMDEYKDFVLKINPGIFPATRGGGGADEGWVFSKVIFSWPATWLVLLVAVLLFNMLLPSFYVVSSVNAFFITFFVLLTFVTHY